MQQVLTEKTLIFMLINTEKKIIGNDRNCMHYSYHGCKKKKYAVRCRRKRVKCRRKQTSVQRTVLKPLTIENGVRWAPRHIPAVLEGSAQPWGWFLLPEPDAAGPCGRVAGNGFGGTSRAAT